MGFGVYGMPKSELEYTNQLIMRTTLHLFRNVTFGLLLCCFLFSLNTEVKAQCDPFLTVPVYPIDLCNASNFNVIGSYQLFDECCTNQQGNQSCFILRVPNCENLGALQFCFDPPCSTDGWIDFGCDPVTGGVFGSDTFDLCKEVICVPESTGDSIDVLVCKPGVANNTIDVSLLGIEKPNLIVDSIVESCMTTFQITGAIEAECNGGASPPIITDLPITISSIADPTLEYLSCSDCFEPVFEYTGPKVTNCNGIEFDYTVTLPATVCAPAQMVTKYAVVYPDIIGDIERTCTGSAIELAFVPNPACPNLQYEWSVGGSAIPGENDSSIVIDPADGMTYTVSVWRDPTAPTCDTFRVSAVAFCCELSIGCPDEDGGLFDCAEDIPAADSSVVTRIDSCYDLVFTIEHDTVGMGCVGDTMFITRRYIVEDDDGDPGTTNERDTCTVIFRVVDDAAPSILAQLILL